MKNTRRWVAGMVVGGMIIGASGGVFAAKSAFISASDSITDQASVYTALPITYCEFVRSVVVEIDGERPVPMGAHYALSYMLQAMELGLIEESAPDSWMRPCTQEEADAILNKLTEEQKTAVETSLAGILATEIAVNGQTLELGDLLPEIYQGKLMIPLRKVAEPLGFTVTWDELTMAATIDDGEIKSTLELGFDHYYYASSQMIGMSAPTSLGAPPRLIHDSTYIPADFLQILFNHTAAYSVVDGVLNITPAGE